MVRFSCVNVSTKSALSTVADVEEAVLVLVLRVDGANISTAREGGGWL